MSSSSAVATIRDLVGPLVAALGCRLYDVEMSGSGRQRTVRVLLDRDGGVDLELITDATRAISPALDEVAGLNGSYLLEVSSPGLERPLRTPEHYTAAIGEAVSISHHTDAGPQRVRGVLVAAGRDTCTLDVEGEPGRSRLRRDHQGAHGVRVGTTAARARQEEAARARQGAHMTGWERREVHSPKASCLSKGVGKS
jgi:ribosome maturation factor RimP